MKKGEIYLKKKFLSLYRNFTKQILIRENTLNLLQNLSEMDKYPEGDMFYLVFGHRIQSWYLKKK